jgi:hypothetical protein
VLISDKRFKDSNLISTIAPSVGLAMIMVLLLDLSTDTTIRRKSSTLFVRMAAYFSAVSSIALLLTKSKDPETTLCYNNAIRQNQADGISLCVVQGVLLFYNLIGVTFAWLAQLVFLYLRVVCKVDTDKYIKHGIAAVLGLPIIPSIFMIQQKLVGYGGRVPWCNFITVVSATDEHGDSDAPRQVLILFATMGVLLGTIGTFCMVSVLLKYTSNLHRTVALVRPDIENVEDSNYRGGFITLKALTIFGGPTALFHFGLAIIWLAILFFPISLVIYKKSFVSIYLSWKACLYSTYFQDRLGVATEDAGRLWNIAKDQCGELPAYNMNRGGGDVGYGIVTFLISGQSIIISMVFLPSRLARYLARKAPNRDVIRYENWLKRMESLSAAAANVGARGFSGGLRIIIPRDSSWDRALPRNGSVLASVMNVLPVAPRIAQSPLQEGDGRGPEPPALRRWSADRKNLVSDGVLASSKFDGKFDRNSAALVRISREQFNAENIGSSGSFGRRALDGLMGAYRASAKDLRPHRDENNINNLPLDPRYMDALHEGLEDLTIAQGTDTKVAERKT